MNHQAIVDLTNSARAIMKKSALIKLTGGSFIVISILGIAYCIFGIYMYFEITNMLYFLTPNPLALVELGLMLAGFIIIGYIGYRLTRRYINPACDIS